MGSLAFVRRAIVRRGSKAIRFTLTQLNWSARLRLHFHKPMAGLRGLHGIPAACFQPMRVGPSLTGLLTDSVGNCGYRLSSRRLMASGRAGSQDLVGACASEATRALLECE
jgi:hypothetical protein